MKKASDLENADEILKLPISYEKRGKEIGREEVRRDIALNMLREGVDVKLIMRFTQLKKGEIEQLKQRLERS